MNTVQNDLDSHGLSWTDAVDLAQNGPLWRPAVGNQWHYALVMVQAREEEEEEEDDIGKHLSRMLGARFDGNWLTSTKLQLKKHLAYFLWTPIHVRCTDEEINKNYNKSIYT